MSMDPETTTLAEATKYVDDNAWKGVECPCCGRLSKVYKRKIHAEMARFLIKLVKLYGETGEWIDARTIHGKKVAKASSDATYLRHWGLLEIGDTGTYKPTQDGIDFVNDEIYVSRYAYVRNNVVLDWDDEETDIRGALGDKFDYDELMGADCENHPCTCDVCACEHPRFSTAIGEGEVDECLACGGRRGDP